MLLTAIFVAILLSLSNDGVPPSALIITMRFMLVDIALIAPILLMARNQDGGDKFSFWTICWPSIPWVALYAFNIWFWFRGVEMKHLAQCMEPRVFFGNFGAYGNIRTFFKYRSSYSESVLLSVALYSFIYLFIDCIVSRCHLRRNGPSIYEVFLGLQKAL